MLASSGMSHFTPLWLETRRAARRLVRSPRFVVVAVLTMAAAVTPSLIFDLVGRAVLPPLPFENSQDLLHVWQRWRRSESRTATSYPELGLLRDRATTMDVAAQSSGAFFLERGASTVRIWGYAVTPNYFDVLRVRPLLGRTFREDENRTPFGHPVVILSETTWRNELAADPDVVGRRVNLNGVTFTVVGVMPPIRERWGGRNLGAGLWVPAMMAPLGSQSAKGRETAAVLESLDTGIWVGIGRLRAGYDLRTAQTEAAVLGREVKNRWPAEESDVPFDVIRMSEDAISGKVVRAVSMMKVAGFLVLAVGAVNLGSLFLARGLERVRAQQLCALLGAPRMVLIHGPLAECLVVGLVGGAAALLLTGGTLQFLHVVEPSLATSPLGQTFDAEGWRIAWPMVGLSFALAMLVTVACGLLPAIAAFRCAETAFREGSTGIVPAGLRRLRPTRPSGLLAVVQIALAVALTLPAVLLARTVGLLVSADIGFRPVGVTTAALKLPVARYPEATQPAAVGHITNELRRVPGVESASWTSCVPINCDFFTSLVRVAASSDKGPEMSIHVVAPDAFRTLGIPLRRGRDFAATDDANALRVAILSDHAAAMLRGADVGSRLELSGQSLELIGIVGDAPYRNLSSAPMPAVYLPLAQRPQAHGVLVSRSSRTTADMAIAMRAAAASIDTRLADGLEVATLSTHVEGEVARYRGAAWLLAAAGLLALFLAGIGIYGLMSSFVARARPEIGLRLALGETRGAIGTTMAWITLRLFVLGVAAGSALGIWVARYLRPYLFRVETWDAASLLATLTVAVLLALLSALGPTLGAVKTDPIRVLRSE